jgi:hypothetical protein
MNASTSTSETFLEPGLPLDEIEARLVESARQHHLEERRMAYWLCEVEKRSLHRERGFSSIGDYARELIDLNPRKAQYLVFIARRLEKLPAIADAFDSGEISWTKAREIVRVATPATEAEWLEKAKRLTSRDLEKEVRGFEGTGTGEWATLTISLPVELLHLWNDGYELSERLCASELEKYQVLELLLAEYLGTYVPAENEDGPSPRENEDERSIPPELRRKALERAGYRCQFPGCSMRKMLDVHHRCFRSHGGGHELDNLCVLCRVHHALVHRGICKISEGPEGLVFERPRLVTEKPREVPPPVKPDDGPPEVEEDSDHWRDQVVADIFDRPPSPKAPRSEKSYGDFLTEWVDRRLELDREARALSRRRAVERRFGRNGAREHVFATMDDACRSRSESGRADST